jgi:dephospho-CoA kinase
MDIRSNKAQKFQRIIGLTGGIGMGKTAVSEYLATVHRFPILDADVYAREAVEPGSHILEEIVERYGSGILLPDGTLNRQRLGDIIFRSSPERLWLEQQIHPYVRDRFMAALNTSPLDNPQHTPTIVMVIPLLFEARMTDLVTETWVVRCSLDQQLERLMRRDRLSLKQAQARISSQMAIQKKTDRADVVLDNSSTLENLFKQVDLRLTHQPKKLTVPHG